MSTNGHTNRSHAAPKILLYTNHQCPYAHRAHITLEELGLPYEEVIIDLERPREQWYLDVNPRGLVPSIKYGPNEEIITESAIVAQFLVDSFPSHLMPKSQEGALERARIAFFVDTWGSKISSLYFPLMTASPEDKEAKTSALVAAVQKELEPLLSAVSADKPFFGGSKDLTFAEVIGAPFVLRWYALAKDGEVIPGSLAKQLDALPKFGIWAKAVTSHPSVLKIWDEKKAVGGMKRKLASLKAQEK